MAKIGFKKTISRKKARRIKKRFKKAHHGKRPCKGH